MGSVLSDGQKQRILIARALYQKPKILLLDEVISHLDTAKEQQISQTIDTLNTTHVMTVHRPQAIKSADRVIHLTARYT